MIEDLPLEKDSRTRWVRKYVLFISKEGMISMLFKLSWTLESNINFSNLFYEATKLELNSDMAVQKQKTIINCPYEYGYKNPRWLLANRTQPCTWSVTLWPCVICSRKDNLIQSQEFWQCNLLQEIKGQSYIINAENLFYKIISHFLIKMLNKIANFLNI